MENINSENPMELSLKQKIEFVQSYQRTFNNWKSNYLTRVNHFVNDFVDNSEVIFIENEIESIEDVLLQLDQALKENYFEKNSIDFLDINPVRDLYIDVRIESAVKSKSTYKKIKSFLEQRKNEIEFKENTQTKPGPEKKQSNKIQDIENLHNEIFLGSSFEIWQAMFDKFQIEKSKRTDVNFMFEVMKYNNLIHKNVGYKYMQDWINEVYQITMDKITFTDHKTKSNSMRLIIYNEIVTK